MLALTTGMRRGEILGLRWPDIDLTRRQMIIQKTKNGDRRAAPIVASVLPMLTQHAKVRPLRGDLVFASKPDPERPIYFDHVFQDVVRAAKIENFRFYYLRPSSPPFPFSPLPMFSPTTPPRSSPIPPRVPWASAPPPTFPFPHWRICFCLT